MPLGAFTRPGQLLHPDRWFTTEPQVCSSENRQVPMHHVPLIGACVYLTRRFSWSDRRRVDRLRARDQ
jgi:hypothetical protein